jgi:hypothetical protein
MLVQDAKQVPPDCSGRAPSVACAMLESVSGRSRRLNASEKAGQNG